MLVFRKILRTYQMDEPLIVSRLVLDDFTVDNVQESSRNFSEWLVFITLKLTCFP